MQNNSGPSRHSHGAAKHVPAHQTDPRTDAGFFRGRILVHPGERALRDAAIDVPRVRLRADRPCDDSPLRSSRTTSTSVGSFTIADQEYRCLWLMAPAEQSPDRPGDLYIFYPESLRRTAVARRGPAALAARRAAGSAVRWRWRSARGCAPRPRPRRPHSADRRRRLPPDARSGRERRTPRPLESVNDMARRLAAFQEELQRPNGCGCSGSFPAGSPTSSATPPRGRSWPRVCSWRRTPRRPGAAAGRTPTTRPHRGEPEAVPRPWQAAGGAKQPCDLVKLIDQAVSLLRPQCQHAGTVLGGSRRRAACVPRRPGGLAPVRERDRQRGWRRPGPGGAVAFKPPRRTGAA